MNVAVIPARGGSKRIPRKNIKEFCGKSMIAWPIDFTKQSNLFDHILVSTDDEEIAEISKSCGADVPFMRPAELSDDYVGTAEVIAHAVSWMHEQGWQVDAVCCIYATSVFLNKDDLVKGFEALNTGKWKYAFSVTDFEYSIFRSFKEIPSGGVEMFFSEYFKKRSQDLPIALHDAAQFYWGKPDAWLSSLKMFERHSYPVIIPRWRVQDIDTEDDWKRAELLFTTQMLTN
ncbi:MAG: pseudaminic acid cytidylyltransferase [Candidatus Marinimicrobia bacterium]|jgi:pseudaminic acid cytidylyltransferase|nr:pseudaminic acid cytidylyltransferase [Candidatus Neomarinimicrobiota bacterium]